MEDVGPSQDKVMSFISDETVSEAEEGWYDALDIEVNECVKTAREYINKQPNTTSPATTTMRTETPQFKLKKIEMQTFESDHRLYYKWKEQFDRYTKHLTDEMKYDYLLVVN